MVVKYINDVGVLLCAFDIDKIQIKNGKQFQFSWKKSIIVVTMSQIHLITVCVKNEDELVEEKKLDSVNKTLITICVKGQKTKFIQCVFVVIWVNDFV